MNFRFVLAAVGKLCLFLAVILLASAGFALAECHPVAGTGGLMQPRLAGFWAGIAGALLAGMLLVRAGRHRPGSSLVREGFAIVTLGWIVLTGFSCLPLFTWLLSRTPPGTPFRAARCFTDAYFEIMSGFTTTGATILGDVEALPGGLLLWRSLTHWFGGMGIVTLALAIFPAFGVAGYQMFRGELPGPTKERLKPRLAQTASILWSVYLLLTAAETLLLKLGGMSWLDAACHAFATMGTGGFSNRNASVGAYGSAFIEWVVIVFMFIAGTNFLLHYRILFGARVSLLWKDAEYRFYAAVVGTAILISTLLLAAGGRPPEAAAPSGAAPGATAAVLAGAASEPQRAAAGLVRLAVFQVVSVTTTTGFCTADYDRWPEPLRLLLVSLMFFGGCAGSTAGGIKMFRVMVVLKAAWRQVRIMVTPRLVAPIKCGGAVVREDVVQKIIGFVMLFMLLFVCCSFVMCWFVPDLVTAVTSVAATLCNVGPGLAGVGPAQTYAGVALPGKWVLIACMLLGRLEIFTVLIAFAPLSWRK